MNTEFAMTCRIYFEDTDAGGVVYHANYLKFAERARTEWLRSYGFDQSRLLVEHNIAFVVTRCEIDYKKPARLDDIITVMVKITELGASRIILQQTIEKDSVCLADLAVTVATIDQTGRAVRLPDVMRNAFR